MLFAVIGATLACAPLAGTATAAKPTRPVVKTGAAGTVTYQSALLSGSINPGGLPTTYFFQFGPTARYGDQSLPATLTGGTGAVAVRSPIAGLIPVVKYHYRLVAVNTLGTALGADAVFTTRAIPLTLAIAALPNPVVFGAPLSVVGALTGTGAAGRQVVLQQNPYPYTAGFQNVGNPQVTLPTGAFQFNLLNLALATQFRVVSVGAGQPIVSPVVTEEVALAVTMRVRTKRTRTGSYTVSFSGFVTPAEPGARVSIQRLVGSQWKLVTATNAGPASATGSSSYARTIRRRHGGFYRVYVTPVEGAHTASASQPLLVHLGHSTS